MKTKCTRTRGNHGGLVVAAFVVCNQLLVAAPQGPAPQIPEGGGPPGPFPNTSVSAVNVIAKGSSVFDGRVEVPGFDGQGPIAWSLNRYNRGDFALRLAPGDPVAALGNLGQGFIDFADNSPGVAASQAWRPSQSFGVVIPTARQNGPIDWGDGEGPFYPTVAISWASSGPSYNMADGSFGTGGLDINTGRAGTHSSSPEANFSFSATWFPFDQGWLGGDVAGPTADGWSGWTSADAHAAGLSAGLVKWIEYPAGSMTYGGLAELRLPGVNTLQDGMLFTTSSDGSSDVNIVGVAPRDDGSAWIVTIREDSATDAETLAAADQSEFQFVYIPFSAQRLIGGHILGADGSKRKAVGDFTVTRTGVGTYEMTVPGKTGADGTLLLQVADFEPDTSPQLASRAFLSYEYRNGKFVIQSRKTTSDTNAELFDSNFYVAWVDFKEPLALPDGPRMRSLGPVAVTEEGVVAKESGVALNLDSPEALVVFIDSVNFRAEYDPITGAIATYAVMGRFYNPANLQPISDPFIIAGNPYGTISRCDVKYNPVSKQYVVVATARAYSSYGTDVPLVALVNSRSVANGGPLLAKVWVHHPESEESYDDIAVAVSSRNGNFLLVAERKATDEGESTGGCLYDKDGNRLTAFFTRLDLLQSVGDEDDPDVIYHDGLKAFVYISNTDNSNGSTGTLSNRIVGSIVDDAPNAQGQLVVRVEQPLSDGLPAGRTEGHPAAIANPFNGELIVAYDAGNDTSQGDLSFFNLGTPPDYVFSPARPEVPYLNGASGNPFNHRHPQLAADPEHGVIVVGFNAAGSAVGLPEAYAFLLLGPDGQPLPSQLGAPYFLADSPGGLGGSVNYHNIKYSPASKSFLAVYTSSPGITYLASLAITSSHLPPVTPPALSVTIQGDNVIISWPATATGLALQSTTTLSPPAWQDSGLAPVMEGDRFKVTVTVSGPSKFFRLISR